jgi:hypothetical protein
VIDKNYTISYSKKIKKLRNKSIKSQESYRKHEKALMLF